ncbi:sulfotransferase [Moritella sp. 5]|uniref:sulfotransferase n=1 Tax=Moritella sp. 5 TaxID=2746231 RepID=UPI001BA4A2BD|nr:sulfotransferase [Moritella sp. 5]QUM81031.1 sulfotransferase [Moritella sp. 5]
MSTKKQKLIFLSAASHSGTTLTAMLLGAHPDLCCVGELMTPRLGGKERYLCSCQTIIDECSFWSGISDKMANKGQNFSISNARTDIRTDATPYMLHLFKPLVRSPFIELLRDGLLSLSPTWREQSPKLQQRTTDYVSAIIEQTGSQAVVDSSKIGIRLKYLLKNEDLDVRVIWVIRDGRGVSLAYKNPSKYADAKDPKLRGGGSGETQEQGRTISAAAREWLRSNQESEALLATMDQDKWIKVYYEDICKNTGNTLDRIFEFIGVDPTKKRLDFKTVEHHVVGNGMRLDLSEVIKLDEQWQSELTAEELKGFYSVAGDYLKSMGY